MSRTSSRTRQGLLSVDLGPGIDAWFTTTADLGVSASLTARPGNYSFAVGENRGAVARRRANLEDKLGAPVFYVRQVHGRAVEVVTRKTARDADGAVANADGLCSREPGCVLAIQAADCAPVLLADPLNRVVGAVHVGREGLLQGILEAALDRMVSQGASMRSIRAAIGPTICGACYEVSPQLQERAARLIPAAASTSRWGTPAIDIVAGISALLSDRHIFAQLEHAICTRENDSCFSFRRQGELSGRHLGLVEVSVDGDAGVVHDKI